ncbi:MAG: VWA domain-containing protein [Halobaculum sp.]
MRHTLGTVAVVALVVLAGCAGSGGGDGGGVDDGSETIGLSVGGAQDAGGFRQNVREGYVPQPTDITYEGLFHDHYFDTGRERPCEGLFCPSYSRALATDPVSGERERFVTVGLDSGLSEADLERTKLNLVVVLDTSGSMRESFDRYYYDGGERQEVGSRQSKMDAARAAVATLTTHLEDGDRFGLVTYDENARVVQEMRAVGETDMGALRERIRGIGTGGSTNLDAGMATAKRMLAPYRDARAVTGERARTPRTPRFDSRRPSRFSTTRRSSDAASGSAESEYETRVIYVTDAMPNTGETGVVSLQSRLQSHANDGIHSTFVGVGVDFNSRFVEAITSVRGGNYYTVHSPRQFEKRMDEGFDHMVTPLVFDLSLSVEGSGYAIEKVYGTTSEGESTATLVSVKTLFPSRTSGGKTEGGVVLLELERTGSNPELRMTASYEDRAGTRHERTRTIAFEDRSAPYFESSGVRKAVALAQYAAVMRNWAAYERAQVTGRSAPAPETIDDPVEHRALGRWEQRSVSLRVSPLYRQRFDRFEAWFDTHRRALGEGALAEDARVLDALTANATRATSGATG